MHDIRYNEKTDEISVTNPFAQAILTFKGDAKGAEPPIRIIQGPHTELGSEDTLAIDSANGEIYIPQGDGFRVYPVAGNGDVAPLRVIRAAPLDTPALQIGNPGAVAYDSKREEILVPN